MRHDWIFDVLTDLKAYAQANGMAALARKTDEALEVARDEVRRVTLEGEQAESDSARKRPPAH